MKKIPLFLLFIFLLPSVASAQYFTVGPKVGINISNIVGDDVNGARARLHFTAGAFGEYRFNDLWAVEMDIMYSGQGTKFNNLDEFNDVKLRLGYLNIPILAKVYVYNGLNVFVGPQIGFLLSAKEKFGGTTVDIKDSFNKVGLDAVIGIGYNFNFGLNLFANYNIGITRAFKSIDGVTVKARNSVFQIGASWGWKF